MPISRRFAALSISVACVLSGPVSRACTTFAIPGAPGRIVAKSFEWDQSIGMALHNKRGVEKTAILVNGGGSPLRWTSRYSSFTFSQYGREFPLSGMNEKGLVVEIMVLSSSQYPERGAEPATNELQWIQFILDTAATTAEARSQASRARVVNLQQKVHYLVCDPTGACATFEYLGGKLVVHSQGGLPVPTLTNNSYAESLSFLGGFVGFGGSTPIPQGSDSLSRFVRASSLAAKYSPGQPEVAYADAALRGLSAGTQWSIVWEPRAQKVHFRTANAPGLKSVRIGDFPKGCRAAVGFLDMEAHARDGDMTSQFTGYESASARAILVNNHRMPAPLVDLALSYPETGTRCTE